MTSTKNIKKKHSPREPVTTYHEKKIGNTLYRITSVHKDEIELGRALEELTVKKILALENSPTQYASQM